MVAATRASRTNRSMSAAGIAKGSCALANTFPGLGPIKVASMTDHAAAIELVNRVALQRVAEALRTHPDIAPGDALAVADLLEKLALAPPQTFKEKRARRDDLLRAAANRFYAGSTRWMAAKGLGKGLARYAGSAWRDEKDLADYPSGGTIKDFFWRILKLIDQPIGAKQIARILRARDGHVAPFKCPSAAA
jgi:hypothetical protein